MLTIAQFSTVIFRKNPTFDFTVPQPYTSDGVLVIDGIRLHVSKAVLLHILPFYFSLRSHEVKEKRIKGKGTKKKRHFHHVRTRQFISLAIE